MLVPKSTAPLIAIEGPQLTEERDMKNKTIEYHCKMIFGGGGNPEAPLPMYETLSRDSELYVVLQEPKC